MAEQIYLDPTEIDSSRVQVEITPWVKADPGVSWGDVNVVPYKAQGERGESVIDYRLENRPIGIPLALVARGGTTFGTIRSTLQGVVARWIQEGGVIKRVTQQGTVYADVPIAGMSQGGNFLQALQRGDTDAELHLEAIPDFYEPEVEIASAEEKTNPELIKVIPDPGGDMPARVRVVVEEKQGVDQKGVIWGFRSRRYSSATTARSAYSATELQPLGASAKEAVTGAVSGTAVSNTSLTSAWGPVVGTNLGGTTWLTHEGTYRVYARLRSPQGTAVSARFVWDVGDLIYPTENSGWRFPGGSAWYVADLGEVRLQAPPAGTYRWQGQVQAKGTEGGEDINVDRIWFVNEDEGMGVLSGSSASAPSVVAPSAVDSFTSTTAGTLTGKVAQLGGTWSGAGDAVDFSVDTTNHWVTRAEKGDVAFVGGRYCRLGTGTATGLEAQLDCRMPIPLASCRQALVLRYIDVNNWMMVGLSSQAEPAYAFAFIQKCVAGTVTPIAISTSIPITAGEWRTIRAVVTTTGQVTAYSGPQGAAGVALVTGADSALATGGTLASGGYGIYDEYNGSSSIQRAYDNFYLATSATPDAVVYASQKAQLTTKGMAREALGAPGSYAPVSRVIGDLPRLPAGGNEGRSVELLVKASRGDFAQFADAGVDDIAVKVYASRSWLTVPGT